MNSKQAYDFCLFAIPPKGKRVIREITNTCNYACTYCIFSSWPQKDTHELTTQEVLHTLDTCKRKGITHIKITWGEPFVRKDMIEILEYAAKKKFIIDISTNASLITDEIAQRLSKIQLKYVHVSLDAHTAPIQSIVRGTSSFERTLTGIKNLIRHGVYTRIGTLIFDANEQKIEAMIQFLISLEVPEVIFSLMEPVGKMKWKKNNLAHKTSTTLQKELVRYQKIYHKKITIWYAFTPESTHTDCSTTTTCPGADKFYYINNTGNVSPCTWIVQYMKQFQSQETLKTASFAAITSRSANIQQFRKILDTIARYGITWCPKNFFTTFQEFHTIQKLFTGNMEKNIKKNGKYSLCSPLYAFTTEHIAGYYPKYNFQSKTVLTVGGSWDHAINALLLWAKEVTCFDINLLSTFFIDLKYTALQRLSFTAFKEFFFRNTSKTLSKEIYKKLSPHLQASSRYFFDLLYAKYHTGQRLRESSLFNNLYDSDKAKLHHNLYLQNRAKYIQAQQAAKTHTIGHISMSLQDICQKKMLEEKQYDMICLSNISDYSSNIFPHDRHLNAFKTEIIDYLIDHTKPKGMVMLGYVYDQDAKKHRSDIDNPILRKKIFTYPKYKETIIASAISDDKKDIILSIQK